MDIDALAKAKYISLTTFKKDGTPVANPVWLARDGDRLVVLTERSAGKAKRLRNGGRVLVAPCDMRGRARGEAIEGTAQLQDAAETAATLALIRQRYGIQARLAFWRQDRKARGTQAGTHVGAHVGAHVGIAISLDGSASTSEV
jgi:PPOX class probable F420-dependent enzyme